MKFWLTKYHLMIYGITCVHIQRRVFAYAKIATTANIFFFCLVAIVFCCCCCFFVVVFFFFCFVFCFFFFFFFFFFFLFISCFFNTTSKRKEFITNINNGCFNIISEKNYGSPMATSKENIHKSVILFWLSFRSLSHLALLNPTLATRRLWGGRRGC